MRPERPGRPAITGRTGDRVWDVLQLTSAVEPEAFTAWPHLTLGLNSEHDEATVTIPNSVNATTRRKLVELKEDGFRDLIAHILRNMTPLLNRTAGAAPWFRGVQRRYPSQRAVPFIDARIDFDLRTAVSCSGKPKIQPRWLSVAYGSFVNKEGSNYQIQVGMLFPNDECPDIREPTGIDLIAQAWLACKPLIDLAR